jgi:hypothetical protein
MRETGRASDRNSISISTASLMISSMMVGCVRRLRCEKRRQATGERQREETSGLAHRGAKGGWKGLTVCVKTLVSRDELVGEGESGHESSLLEPEDGSERSREEDY